jgi:hypothetical protein
MGMISIRELTQIIDYLEQINDTGERVSCGDGVDRGE